MIIKISHTIMHQKERYYSMFAFYLNLIILIVKKADVMLQWTFILIVSCNKRGADSNLLKFFKYVGTLGALLKCSCWYIWLALFCSVSYMWAWTYFLAFEGYLPHMQSTSKQTCYFLFTKTGRKGLMALAIETPRQTEPIQKCYG